MERTPNNDGINASYVDIPNSTAVDHLVSIIYAPGYATKRVKSHLLRFLTLYEQLTSGSLEEPWLSRLESLDNIFPDVNYHHWA